MFKSQARRTGPSVDGTPATKYTSQDQLVRKLPSVALGIAGLVLLANALLFGGHLKFQRDQVILASEMVMTRQAMLEYDGPQTVERLVSQAHLELTAEQSTFPSVLSGSGVVGDLLKIAEANGLKVTEANSKPGEERILGEHIYGSLAVDVQVSGTFAALKSFVSALEGGALPGASLEEVHIEEIGTSPSITPPLDGEDFDLAHSGQSLTASLVLTVYARYGSD